MKNRKYVIGIAGTKGSGKDTLAHMIDYILKTGTKANYRNYVLSVNESSNTIIHFADNLKDILSKLFNINRSYFDNEHTKNEVYFDVKTGKVVTTDTHTLITDEIFSNSLSTYADSGKNYATTLRTLMQYFGTEIGRNLLGKNIWINSCISNAYSIARSFGYCIIADVRFDNENKSIHSAFPYGVTILINRKDNKNDKHSSEVIDFECDYIINNDRGLNNLFYSALEIVQKIKELES